MEITTFNPSSVATWNQARDSEHLNSFVTSKLALLTDVEL
jgi:hypothetical protein